MRPEIVARKIVQGVARGKARVLIGRDTRESGPHIAGQIARGLSAAGAEAVSAGVLTTPGVAWLVSREGFAAGVVVSASHNPSLESHVPHAQARRPGAAEQASAGWF